MKSAIIACGVFCAVLLGFYLFQQSNASAQSPVTTRVVNATPQGEWIVVTQAYSNRPQYGLAVNANQAIDQGSTSIVMVHTGTGKVRIVKWQDYGAADKNPNMRVYETP